MCIISSSRTFVVAAYGLGGVLRQTWQTDRFWFLVGKKFSGRTISIVNVEVEGAGHDPSLCDIVDLDFLDGCLF